MGLIIVCHLCSICDIFCRQYLRSKKFLRYRGKTSSCHYATCVTLLLTSKLTGLNNFLNKQYQVVGEGEARETETQPPVLSLQEEKQDLAYKIFPILKDMFPDSDICLVAKATVMIIMSENIKNLMKDEEDLGP